RRAAAAGAGGEAAGVVRPGRYATHRRWPGAADPAPAVAGRPAVAGHPGSAQFLGEHLRRGEEGDEGPLPAPPVAGRPLDGYGDPPGQAARDVMRADTPPVPEWLR